MANASTWNRRLRRLTAMDRHELLDRLRQYIAARTDPLRYRGRSALEDATITEAEPAGHFFFAPGDVASLCALLKQSFPSRAENIVLQAEKICRHRFDLLGYEDLDYGAEIDWHCDVVHGRSAPRKPWFQIKYLDFEEVGDSKIIWELNRHQHFVTLAKAYCLTGEEKFVREIFAQWSHWHQQNPYPIGINWASSLEGQFPQLIVDLDIFLLSQPVCRFSRVIGPSWKTVAVCPEPEWTPHRNVSVDLFLTQYAPAGRGSGSVLPGDSLSEFAVRLAMAASRLGNPRG